MGSVTDGPEVVQAGGGGGANAQRDAIAQQLMAQQAMSGVGGMDPRLANISFGNGYGPSPQPSGNITDVGWMNAQQPWQGGVTSGGFPAGALSNNPWLGGGSMTYYGGACGGPKYLPNGGLDPNDPGNIALYYRLMGMGGGMGAASYGGMSAPGGGAGVSGASVSGGRGGSPNQGSSPQGLSPAATGFEGYTRASQDMPESHYSGVVGPTNDAFTTDLGAFSYGFGNPTGFDPSPGPIGMMGEIGDDTGGPTTGQGGYF